MEPKKCAWTPVVNGVCGKGVAGGGMHAHTHPSGCLGPEYLGEGIGHPKEKDLRQAHEYMTFRLRPTEHVPARRTGNTEHSTAR